MSDPALPTAIPAGVTHRSAQELLYNIWELAQTAGGEMVSISQATPGTSNHVDLTSRNAPVDRSGTITAGGTAQQIAAANAARTYFFIQNTSDTGMWVNWGVAAVASEPSIYLAPGAGYENPPHWCPVGTISVIGPTTGKIFTAKESA